MISKETREPVFDHHGSAWGVRIGRTEQIWVALIVMAPIGFLSVLNWSGIFLLVMALFSCGVLVQQRSASQPSGRTPPWHLAVFLSPVLALAVSQALRLEINLPDFDAPSRLFAATVVYLALRRSRLSPQVTMFTLIAGIALGVPSAWWGMTAESISAWGNRFATPHSDTNAFGSFMGLFVCMLSGAHLLRAQHSRSAVEVLLSIGFSASITLAIYLLLGTHGRGAWISTTLGLIVVAGVVAYARPQGLRGRALWLLAGLAAAPIAINLLAPDTLNSILGRTQSIPSEIIRWQQGTERDSSGGMRLEMNAAAFELFLRAPLSGYGDFGYAALAREPWMATRYSEGLVHMLTTAGPHNEFWARTLQAGIWGAMAVCLFSVIPTVAFFRTLRLRTQEALFTGGIGLIAMSYLFLVQFSNEFSLKYIASFIAILIAVMLASAANLLNDHRHAQVI